MAKKKKTTKASKPEQSKAKAQEIKEEVKVEEEAKVEEVKEETKATDTKANDAKTKNEKAKDTKAKNDKAKSKDAKAQEKTGAGKVFGKIKQFFKDVKSECKKIVWSSWSNTIKDTGVVLLVTVIVGAGVWICDLLFRQLVELVYASAGAADAAMIALQNLTTLL